MCAGAAEYACDRLTSGAALAGLARRRLVDAERGRLRTVRVAPCSYAKGCAGK